MLELEDLRIGTVLVDKDGCQHKVLDKRFEGRFFLLSRHNKLNQKGHLWTLEEINARKNKILSYNPPKYGGVQSPT